MSENESVTIDRNRAALIIQDMQNDVMMEGGAFADSGAPQHAKEQNAVENCRRLAEACRGAGIPVIHVWYIVEDGSRGLKVNAPLFEGVKEANALVRGSWGAQPAEGLEPKDGDYEAVVDFYRREDVLGRAVQQPGCLGSELHVPYLSRSS